MMKINVYKRLTHEYRIGYDHLNDHAFVGVGKMLKPKVISRDSDGTGYTSRTVLTFTGAQKRAIEARHGKGNRHWIARAIEDSLDYGCSCEHDCCGHMQTYSVVSPVPGKPREYSVELRNFMNV